MVKRLFYRDGVVPNVGTCRHNLDADKENDRVYGDAYTWFGQGENGHNACAAIDALCKVHHLDIFFMSPGVFSHMKIVNDWKCCSS